MLYTLEGFWQADIGDGNFYSMYLPGTLDESQIGYRDGGSSKWHPDVDMGNMQEDFTLDAPITTRFTRKYTYEGAVRLTRSFTFAEPSGKRIFLEAERARCLALLVDGREVPCFREATISTPYAVA